MNPASSIPGSASEGLSEIQFDLAMMDDFPAMVWGMRLDGTVCYFSKAARAFSGDASGADWYERVHPEDRERCFATMHAAFAKRVPFDLQFRMRRHDGQYRRVVDRGAPMRNAQGEIGGYLGVAHDVTEQYTADEMRRESARLVRILEATTDFVGMASAEGRMLFVNAAGRKMLGLAPEDSLPAQISDCHPEWANEIVLKEAVPAAIRDGSSQAESALLTKDGREVPVSQLVLAHAGADGKTEFLSTIIRDLSDRKREDVARIEWANRYDAAIRASGQVLFDWNSKTGEITYAGDLLRLLGYSAAEMGGGLETLRQLIHPFDLESFDLEVQRVTATRDPFHLEFRARHKDENYRCIGAKGYFFLDRQGQIGRMIGFFADVTAQRHAQEALAQAHEGLEARVEARTAELARAHVVNQERALQQEAVAHLGRQALRGARLDSLLDEAVVLIRTILHVDYCTVLQLEPGGETLVATAQVGWPDLQSGNRVPIARSQSGYTLRTGVPVIVTDMAKETRFEMSGAVAASNVVSGVSVVIEAGEAPLGVLCAFTTVQRTFVPEDIHFLQAIANVLTEAIQRQRIEESIRLAHDRAEAGSRVKSEFLSRMSHDLRTPLNAILGFTQLLELDSPTPSQSESIEHISRAGQNLLTLINTVLDISRLDSAETAFPGEPPPLAPAAPQPPITTATTHTFLYIEDQDLNLRLVERILQPHPHYRLLTAQLGHLGLQLARQHHPDLILLDLNLPDISGDEVLRQLRLDPATRHIPILMVSADAIGERIQELLRNGATGYLTKPYKVAELLRVIEETLPPGESPKSTHP